MKRPLRGTAVRGDAGEAPGGLRGENIALAVSPRLSNIVRVRYPRACMIAVYSSDDEAVAMETDRVLTNVAPLSDQIRLDYQP